MINSRTIKNVPLGFVAGRIGVNLPPCVSPSDTLESVRMDPNKYYNFIDAVVLRVRGGDPSQSGV